MKKIALFVDVQNIYYTCRQKFNRQFNYRNLLQELAKQGELVHANAYAISSRDDGQKKFQDALRHMGFNVKLKPYIQRRDGSAKGDWDVGITIDVMQLAPDVDQVILLSGDGDFDLLLQKISELHHTKTLVYGVEALTAKSLIDSADHYIPIESHLLQ